MGISVWEEALGAQLSADVRSSLGPEVYYCPSPSCDVAYFDTTGNTLPLSVVARPAYPKPASAPLCRCLGVTAEAIIEEAKRGDRGLIRRLVAQAESDTRSCARRMPSGLPCATEARRLFMAFFPSP